MAKERTIVLLRHAKSAWGVDVPDLERPLSKRGKRDSIAVGDYLQKQKLEPDLVLCSPAVRARETWRRAVKAGARADDVVYLDQLYESVAHELIKVLRKTPDEVRTVLLVGHSPAVPDLVEQLAPRDGNRELWIRMDTKFPTSGIATLQFGGGWPDLQRQSAELLGFDVPRGEKGDKSKKSKKDKKK